MYKKHDNVNNKDLKVIFTRWFTPDEASTSTSQPRPELHRDAATIWLATLLAVKLFVNRLGNIVLFTYLELM